MSIPWLQQLPDRWETVRLKTIIQLGTDRVNERTLEDNYIGLENIESWTGRLLPSTSIAEANADEDKASSTANQFEPGDVLFGKLRPYLAKAYLAKEFGICTTELIVMKPTNRVDGHFLLNVLLTREFIDQVNAETFGAKMPRADWNTISNMFVPLPPLHEQSAIADYLEREITKLDALIAAKQRLLDLLAEKRRALITHAVMRGLNSAAPLQDSGVAWLGEIPAHWGVEYARWLFKEIDRRSTTGEEELLTVSHLTGVTPRSEKDVNMFMAESNEGYKVCQAGDLVINTLWAWMGAMGVAFQDGIVSPAYNVYRSRGQYEPRYVDYLVRIPVFAEEVIRYSKGVWSSRLRLYPEEFFEIVLPIPPINEQQQIIEYLEHEVSKLDNLHVVTEKTISLLQERRTALIAAAVTGQLNIK